MQTYLENLGKHVSEFATGPERKSARIFVMQSSGGITALESAAREPVRTVLSGPAGGLVGAVAMANRSGFRNILSFDMGGTSTDVALVQGEIHAGSQAEVAGFPVGVPMLDIHTVGAGGGSLARFDAGGALRVGPESAGADPGPICYGRGLQPTVTDANLLLGRIQANRFLGGDFTLDLERTRRLTTEWLKQQSSHLSLEQFPAGVIRVVNANMERALRVVSIERGYDPRDFALVAFGGAGGLHACELAESLAIPTVILPAQPGALSAFGILVSDVVKDFSRTLLRRLSEKTVATQLASEFRELEAAARLQFQQEHWTGKIQLERSLDLRYRGQGYELNVAAHGDLAAAFHKEHQRRYGYHHPSREIEVVTARLRAKIATVPPRSASAERRSSARVAPVDHARVYFGKMVPTPVYERSTIPVGSQLKGPAVIAEYSATTVIPPGKRFTVDHSENVVITER
jgi:N-methylhydantoinase A